MLAVERPLGLSIAHIKSKSMYKLACKGLKTRPWRPLGGPGRRSILGAEFLTTMTAKHITHFPFRGVVDLIALSKTIIAELNSTSRAMFYGHDESAVIEVRAMHFLITHFVP